MPWSISFLLKREENKYFLPHAYCFIYKSALLNPNVAEKKNYFIPFFQKVTFSMSKVNFWSFSFIEIKRLNLDWFTNKNSDKFKDLLVKVSPKKKENILLLIRYYKQCFIRVSKPMPWATTLKISAKKWKILEKWRKTYNRRRNLLFFYFHNKNLIPIWLNTIFLWQNEKIQIVQKLHWIKILNK